MIKPNKNKGQSLMENIVHWNLEKSTTNSADFIEKLVRESARKMFAVALESEVDQFIQKHQCKSTIKHPIKVQQEFPLSPVGIPLKMQVK